MTLDMGVYVPQKSRNTKLFCRRAFEIVNTYRDKRLIASLTNSSLKRHLKSRMNSLGISTEPILDTRARTLKGIDICEVMF